MSQSQEYAYTKASATPIRIVERSRIPDAGRDSSPHIRRYDYLKEANFAFTNRNRPSVIVNADTGFEVVPPDESVVYISRNADGT